MLLLASLLKGMGRISLEVRDGGERGAKGSREGSPEEGLIRGVATKKSGGGAAGFGEARCEGM
jgi:hypothetical protein